MTNISKKQINNPIPLHIKELTLAFDVSTNKTGYAFLIDGKPFKENNGMPSFGYLDMVKQITKGKSGQDIKPKNKEYDTYGNRMFHGSYKPVQRLMNVIYQLEAIQDTHLQQKKLGKKGVTIDKFNIVFEVSEIPQIGKFGGQTMTTTRKLALYVGYILGMTTDMIQLILPSFAPKAVVKLIKPTEWQIRAGFTKSGLSYKQEMARYSNKWSKLQSLERANEMLVEWGYKKTSNDDLADALNIASLANEVRDNLFVRGYNAKRGVDIKKIESEIAKASNKIAEYKSKALETKMTLIDNVLWAKSTTRVYLSAQDKAKQTKYLKYDLEMIRNNDFKDYFTPAQLRKFNEFTERKANLEAKIKSLRAEKLEVK